jgi:hypothetical protein
VLEDARIGIADCWRTRADNTTLVEQAEQAAASERALQSAGKRGRDGLAHGGAREVGEDAVGERLEF